MKIKFENKSMDSYYHMMSISFEGTINKIRNENISKLNILVKNEIAAELCIMAVAEHVRKRFNGYVEIYGEENYQRWILISLRIRFIIYSLMRLNQYGKKSYQLCD